MPSLLQCTKCRLAQTATTVCMIGRGSETPQILFVGEAPGRNEDIQGVPFIGAAGRKLDDAMKEAGIDPSICRWTNTVRCVPWQDPAKTDVRPPAEDEVLACKDYLTDEILKYKPKVIVAVGGTAARYFTGQTYITKARGKKYWYKIGDQQFLVVPIIHTAAVLRGNAHYWTDIIADLTYVKRIVVGEDETTDYAIINDQHSLEEYTEFLLRGYQSGEIKYITVDVETIGYPERPDAGLDPFDARSRLLTVQITHAHGQGRMILVDHKASVFRDDMLKYALVGCLKRILSTIPVGGQNYKFDFKWLYCKLGIITRKVVFDTQFGHHCLHGGTEPNNLKYMAAMYCGMAGYENELQAYLAGMPPDQRTMEDASLDVLLRYGCGDSDATFRLVPILTKKLVEAGLFDAFQFLYIDTYENVIFTEINGVKVSQPYLERLAVEFPLKLKEAHGKITESIFHSVFREVRKYEQKRKRTDPPGTPLTQTIYPDINPGSPQQLKQFLYEIMKMPNSCATCTTLAPEHFCLVSYCRAAGTLAMGQSTDKATMKKMVEYAQLKGAPYEEHVYVLEAVLAFKAVQKLYTSYVVNLPGLIADKTGERASIFEPDCGIWHCHPILKLDGTVTGRLSSEAPNIQQIPPGPIKEMFISRFPNGLILEADYSQVELRVFAALSKDKALIEAFKRGIDIHTYTAHRTNKIPLEKVTHDLRRRAKVATFTVLYGGGAGTLAYGTKVSIEEGQKVIDDFWESYPDAHKWHGTQQTLASQQGYIESPLGRRRPLPGINSQIREEKRHAMACAVNTPVQSAASDLTLTASSRIYSSMKQRNMNSLQFALVHDAIDMDTYPGELLPILRLVREEMVENSYKLHPWLCVPIVVDTAIGVSWGRLIDVSIGDDATVELEGQEHYFDEVLAVLHAAYKVRNVESRSFIKDGQPHRAMKMELAV